MKKLTLRTIVCLTLTLFNHATAGLFMQPLDAASKEISYYYPFSSEFYRALRDFLLSNNYKSPEIVCKKCRDRSMLCEDLLLTIQIKSMDMTRQTTDLKAIDVVRQNMVAIYTEMARLLTETSSLTDMKKYMVKIAYKYTIPCEGCHKVNWEATETEDVK